MRSANNPFLATIQNKSSTSSISNNHKCNLNASINISNNDSNDKGRKKLRRQTISDPHAYIRYISSLIGNKCIPKSDSNALANFTTTTAAAAAAAAAVNDDKSQKQCQQQQQLQQISLQFQGISLYDDDVAKSPYSDNNNHTERTTTPTSNSGDTTNNRKIVTPWSWCKEYDDERQTLELQQQHIKTIEDKLTAQILAYNRNTNCNNNNNNNNNSANQRNIWLGTYPQCRGIKKFATTTTATRTTTTTATRMTPKIAPSCVLLAETIRPVLRKHHSFHIQPTQDYTTPTIYRMHKQLQLQRRAALVEEGEEEEVATQQLLKSHYNASYGGPLVFRPLTLNEKHAFKPITDAITTITNTNTTTTTTTRSKYSPLSTIETEEEEQKSEQSEEELKALAYNKQNSNLHPAASLEVLEALTQSNPELIYAVTQPGSRQNLQQQFSQLPSCRAANELRSKLHAKLSNDSNDPATAQHMQERKFYDDEATAVDSECEISPNGTVIISPSRTEVAAQVKYLVRQNCREIHI